MRPTAGKNRRKAPLTIWLAILAALLLHPAAASATPILGKSQLSAMLLGHLPALVRDGSVEINHPTLGKLRVESTIDLRLQSMAEKWLRHRGGRGAALALVDASTGQVLVLAGIRGGKSDPRLSIDCSSPAASLFKVVTATAAIEEARLDPRSKLGFCGRPHTLYRFQLREKQRWKPTRITLQQSFAQSNNPVFARLGIYQVGKESLTRYARYLGFCRPLSFELPVGPGCLMEASDDYSLGEMACGFNSETTTSPLHAALMVATFTQGGVFPQPYLVARVIDAQGRVLYEGKPDRSLPVVSRSTCLQMLEMFEATVKYGTARGAFRRLWRDRILRGLKLGGKTGTIRGKDRSKLYEWFAGFATDPASGRTLAAGVLAVHGKTRFVDPKKVARAMLREAFRPSNVAKR